MMEGEDNSSETISATATLRHYIMEKEEEAKRTQKLSFILVFTTLVLFITYLNWKRVITISKLVKLTWRVPRLVSIEKT